MAAIQTEGDPDELLDIYATLRKLDCIRKLEFEGEKEDIVNGFNFTENDNLFPKRFLLKLLDERLVDLDALGKELVGELFDLINTKGKVEPLPKVSSFPYWSEYFHNALYYIYDFLIELDWHESDIADLSKSDRSFVSNNLELMGRFLTFQQHLASQNRNSTIARSKGRPYVLKILSPATKTGSFKRSAIKSSLSIAESSRIESPSRRRRVRFKDPKLSPRKQRESTTKKLKPLNSPLKQYRDLDDSKSVLALDLLIFTIDLFVQQLCEHFLNRMVSSPNIKETINLAVNAKRKLRSSQFANIARNVKLSNDLCLIILDHLNVIKRDYIKDCVIETLCAHDSKPLLEGYKVPRTQYYINHVDVDVEQKLLTSLAKQNLQILLDLVVHEINLPPVELGAETESKTKTEVSRSRTNYLNLIGEWLGVGLGLSNEAKVKTTDKRTEKTSTIATAGGNDRDGPQFKSSSRILAQMDNLNELMVHLVSQLVNHFQSKQQSRYFLETLIDGFQLAFEVIGQDMKLQADSLRRDMVQLNPAAPQHDIDQIIFKTRCLKYGHILHSFEKLCNDISSKHDLGVTFEATIPEFMNSSTSVASSATK